VFSWLVNYVQSNNLLFCLNKISLPFITQRLFNICKFIRQTPKKLLLLYPVHKQMVQAKNGAKIQFSDD